jgi:hypothetical protein
MFPATSIYGPGEEVVSMRCLAFVIVCTLRGPASVMSVAFIPGRAVMRSLLHVGLNQL